MMEEKILFKEKTHKFLPYIKIALILVIISLVAYYAKELYDYSHFFDDHIHDSSCVGVVDEMDDLIFTEKDYETKRDKYSTFSDYIAGEYDEKQYGYTSSKGFNIEIYNNCDVLEYGSISNANDIFFRQNFDGWVFQWMIWGSIILGLYIILSIFTLKKCSYIVTENTIRGKIGYKKFNIAFSDIKRITKKGKCITIQTENKNIKLSSNKKCNETYDYIKPFVIEEPVIKQVVNNAQSIKNILD